MEYFGAVMAVVAFAAFLAIIGAQIGEPERVCHDCLGKRIKRRWNGEHVCETCGSLEIRTIPRRRGINR